MQENQNNQNQEIEVDENHLIQIRKDKLKELQEQGKNPFEITKYNRTNSAGEIKANYEKFEQKDVSVAGRIIAKRIMGKASPTLAEVVARISSKRISEETAPQNVGISSMILGVTPK